MLPLSAGHVTGVGVGNEVGVQAHWYPVLEIVVVTVTVGPDGVDVADVEVGKTLTSLAPMTVLSILKPVPVPVFK